MADTTEPLVTPSGLSGSEEQRPPSARRRALSDRLPRAWMFPLLVTAIFWIVTVATWNITNLICGWDKPWSTYFWIWDSGFYGGIARQGYGPASWAVPPASSTATSAFFPLYPAVIRAVMTVTGAHVIEAGLITQILAGAAAAVAVWALASHVYGRRVADRAVLLQTGFFGATVLGLMYSEPLAVALAAGCLLATLKRKWVLAGLLALLDGAEHSTMIILAPVLGIAALHAIWTRRDWRSLVAPALAPLGMLAYFAYFGHRYHNYLFWFQIERLGWHQKMDFGRHTLSILAGTNSGAWDSAPAFNAMVVAGFWIAVAAIAALIIYRAPVPITLYTALDLIACAVSQSNVRPRFVFTMTGIFLISAARLPKWAFWPVLAASAALEVFLIGYWPHTVWNHSLTPP